MLPQLLHRLHTPEADVVARALRLALAPPAHLEPDAVVVTAQERAAALHALGHAGLAGVMAFRRPLRVAPRKLSEVFGLIPVRAPLPDVPGHVVQAEAIDRKGAHGRSGQVAIFQRVEVWELALPGVR